MHGHQAILTGEAISSSRGQLHSSEIYIAPRPHTGHSLYIVLERDDTKGAGENGSMIGSPDSDGAIKLSELFTNNGDIAIHIKATSSLDQSVN